LDFYNQHSSLAPGNFELGLWFIYLGGGVGSWELRKAGEKEGKCGARG
jgi:hypothetical protein